MISSLNGPLLITGATGIVCSRLVQLALEQNTPVYALVRDEKKARRLLGNHPLLTLIKGDVAQSVCIPGPLETIVHGASPTSSQSFVSDPAGTIFTCVEGTKQMLLLARQYRVKRFLYLSSAEIYGTFPDYSIVNEELMGALNPLSARASYPESKRLCETLCIAFCKQYGLHATVARLGVTFGPITDMHDRRLLAQFARCVYEKRDIILQTPGRTIRSYCYVDDTARALLLLLAQGEDACAYNVANPDMTYSVYEIAQRISRNYPCTQLVINTKESPESLGYLPELQLKLDTSKLSALGWKPHVDFDEGFQRTVQSIHENML